MEHAARDGLDLIEINPTAFPPVCKIADYGKMMYEKSKKQKARKKAKPLSVKTIQVRPNIGENDLYRKINNIQKFIDKGHRVVVQVVMKGRQRAYSKKAEDLVVNQIKNCLEDVTMEKPNFSGSTITVGFTKNKA